MVATALCPATSFAGEEPRAALIWEAPPECPSRDAVLVLVGKEVDETGPAIASASTRGTVTHDESGTWRAELVVEVAGTHGARVVEGDTCEAVANATALIIAIAMESGAPPASSPPSRPPIAPRSPVVRSEPAPAPPREMHLASRGLSHFVAAVAGVADVGSLPRTSAGVDGSLGWLYTRGPLIATAVATGTYFPAVSGSSVLRGEGGDFSLGTVGGRACVGRIWSSVALTPCAGFVGEFMTAQGQGAGANFPGHGAWPALALGGAVRWSPVSWFGIPLRLEAVVPFVRPQFYLEEPNGGGPTVHRPGIVSGQASLGVEVRFF